jgi:hypothetical protein
MGRRNDIDWDAIERDFRLGRLPLFVTVCIEA